ncbi:MAG: GAF domain-containing protein [Bacteroidetes bacterium]|nr:GAF domain-containing protein [Bacteroidota bacterium]
MSQYLIYIIILLAGASIVAIIFKTKIKQIALQLNLQIDKLINSNGLERKSVLQNTKPAAIGLFSEFQLLGQKIEEISLKPIQVVTKVIDTTASQDKNEFKIKYDNLLIINELGQHVTSSLKLENTFDHLYNTINSIMDAAVFEMGIFNWKDNRWKILSNQPNFNSTTQDHYQNHIAEWSLQNKREVILDDALQDYERYVPNPLLLADGRKPLAIICFPILRQDKEVGTISIMSFSKNAFNEYHIEMIKSLLPYTAVAIGNSLIHNELLNTQEQLVHNEKLASIGQLTSGIAHEILNPLNFVNNFSEVSKELLAEYEQSKSIEDQQDLRTQLVANLDKIHLHGNRAYTIVKNMMLLSRTGDGIKTNINLNKSIEDYLDIAFQGFSLKNKDFSCRIEKIFDSKIPTVELIAEDFGRVLLNLFANAFYTMYEKQRKILQTQTAVLYTYEPELIVKTTLEKSLIIITVRDNGMGIPDEIKAKIFLPFFTTKPTGDGTGLGLSLSHDIITKGNQGNLTVISELGKGSEFKISLPLSSN